MKISDISQNQILSNNTIKDLNKNESNKNNVFSNKLSNLKGNALTQRIEALLGEIDTHTKAIRDRFELNDVLKYKKAVKEFLNLAVTNSHEFSKNNFLDRRGRHRSLALVKQVDTELESLTKDFLSTEQDNLKVLKRLDQIKGMLLDFFI